LKKSRGKPPNLSASAPSYDKYWEHLMVRWLQRAIGRPEISTFEDAQETVVPILAAFDRAIAAGDIVADGATIADRTSRVGSALPHGRRAARSVKCDNWSD
jgi:hypothetical protein